MGTEKGILGEMWLLEEYGLVQIDAPTKIVMNNLLNGVDWKEMFIPLTGIDMLLKHDLTQPLLAFVGTENCGLEIKIVGSSNFFYNFLQFHNLFPHREASICTIAWTILNVLTGKNTRWNS
jgi:hypothetical protein